MELLHLPVVSRPRLNKNTILDFYTFLSNLKVLKYNMQYLEKKNREIHLLVIKENWLSGLADRVWQARRGHGFQQGLSIEIPCFHTGPIQKR